MPSNVTEWYDEGEPVTDLKLDDEDLGLSWSSLGPGSRVRWQTPRFVKRGTVVSISKRSMTIHFDSHTKPTSLPDGKWYWVQGKLGNRQEHLVAISTPAPKTRKKHAQLSLEIPENPDDAITPAEAAAILGIDPKNIRRMIRSNRLRAHRIGGRWVMSRKDVEAHR